MILLRTLQKAPTEATQPEDCELHVQSLVGAPDTSGT
jgi:hypothetical protein